MWSLVSSVGFWEFLEYSFETLVIIGCAGEAIGEFTNIWSLRRNSARRDHLLRISTIILLVGLAGALISTARTNMIAGETIDELDHKAKRAVDDSNEAVRGSAEAKRKSGDAVNSASGAARTAGEAKTSAGEAKGKAEDASRIAGRASVAASNALASAYSAREQLSAAQKARLELQQSLLPRSFDQNAVSRALEPFKGIPAYIETVNDFECRRTAELVRASLIGAHWDVKPVVTRLDDRAMIDFFFPGIHVQDTCNTGESSPGVFESGAAMQQKFEKAKFCWDAQRGLMKGLKDSGLPDVSLQGMDLRYVPRNAIMVRVGLRAIAGEKPSNLIVSPSPSPR